MVQQWDLSCGAAALATILTYQHGDPVPEKTIAETMLQRTDPLTVKVKGGFSLLDLKRFVESRGFHGAGYLSLTLAQLIEIAPAIVPVNLGDYNHFVVFKGIKDDHVFLADPAFGNRFVEVKTFEKSWLQKIGFVVTRGDGPSPPGQLTVRPNDYLYVQPPVIRQALR